MKYHPLAAVLSVLMAACAAPSSIATPGTLSVEESTTLAASPAQVWQVLGDYARLQDWHPAVSASSITKGGAGAPGTVRALTLKDGGRIDEELLAYDGAAHTMRYRILSSPLPVRDYASTLSVEPQASGSRLVWKGQFHRTDAVDDAGALSLFSSIYRAGFDGVRAKLAKP